jgi:hypothetical protein
MTLIVGIAGTVLAWALRGPRDGVGFAIGAAISFTSIHSWLQLAAALGGEGGRSAGASAVFMAMRYALIGAAIYATIKLLGTSPVAMITGLLASFAAVVLELLYANKKLF